MSTGNTLYYTNIKQGKKTSLFFEGYNILSKTIVPNRDHHPINYVKPIMFLPKTMTTDL